MGKLLEDFFNDKVTFLNDFDEETKKALRKNSVINERRKKDLERDNRNLEEEKKESENKINTLRTERKNLLNSRGIETTDKGNPLLIRNYYPNELTIGTKYENKNNTENFENFQNKVRNDENFSNELNTNTKKLYKELSNKSLINQEINTRKAEKQAEESGAVGKVLTSPLLGAWNKFSNLMNDDLIYNEDGTVYKTKTYGELLNEANRNNISGVGGFLYDVGNLAGETATQFIPGIGQANYFSDIAMDKYNENIKNGANVGDAFINATGVSIVDYLKQKALGSLGSSASRLGKGTEKTLENAFEKGFSNIIGNKSLNKILSGTSAEFLDEFTDSIVEQIWDNVTINKNGAFEGMDNADFWKNALYEGLLGAVTGSAGASIKVASTPKSQKIAEQSIYDIERKTGNPLSQNNKNIINNISSVMGMEGNKYTAQQVIDRYNTTREKMVNKFTEDSVNLFPGLDEQHKTQYYQLVNEVAQIMHDTGTDIRFDPNQNTVIDTTGGIITLNPTRTDMPLKNILLHEIAKNIGGQNTQNYVINKLKKDGTYEQRKNELLATGEFDEANVNNEIVAQELDKILSNEEMLKELANKDTNLFNNIKEKIDFLTSKLTNGKNTKDSYYLNALYNNFQRDYGISTTPNKDYVSEIKPKEDKPTVVEEKPLEIDKNGATADNKQQQLDIISKSNPAPNETNTWIRKKEDINTFKEAYDTAKAESEDGGWENYASYPDITNEMVEKALETGKITVYSSYPIENGVFVTPSYQQALDYAGSDESKVNSKEVNLDDVAWINLDEGQYAKVESQPNKEVEKQTVEGEGTETRKTYESILKSPNQSKEAKAVAKELIGLDTYVPDSNKNELQRADDYINKNGVEKSLESLRTNTENTRNNVDDIAIGNRLIEYYSKIGDKENLQEAIQLTAMAGTNVGRAVQAMSLINRQTPTGKVAWVQKTVDKLNKQLKQDYDKKHGLKGKLYQYDFTNEMQQKILNSNDKNIDENVDSVLAELGEQVPMKFIDKLDTWRYFSMLSSPTTHIRNIVGNLTMGGLQDIKNKIRGGIEDIYYKATGKEGERTSTLKFTPKEYKDFAKNDLSNVKDRLSGNKYINPKNGIQKNQRMFKNDVAEKVVKKGLIDTVSNFLEAEDIGTIKIGNKEIKIGGIEWAYQKALSQYLFANKIDLNNITDAQLAKARNFAIDSAKQATFHQDNSLATALNTIENKNLASKLIVGGVIPFKKTPLNVAKTALEYNPAGLLKTITVDSARLYQGKITANQYIDNISKGLTGTGIAMLGYALAQAGLIRTTSDDDESYDEDKGIQPYSIVLGDKTISLDWLSPTAVPMFVGAELQHQFSMKNNDMTEEEKENTLRDSVMNVLNASVSSLNPVSEMTMLSGIQSALKTYSGDYAKALEEMGVNTITTYVNQFTPSILGKITKTTDEFERSTTSTSKTTVGKAIDKIVNQTKSKLPGLRQTLPVKTDVWGNEVKQNENPLLRGVYNLTSPATIKNVRETELDKEINRLYNETGESSVLPKTYITKEFTYNNKTYRLSANEYALYKQILGKDNYNKLNEIIKSNEYKNLSDEEKAKVISKIYSYDRDAMKVAYAKQHNITYKDDSYETEKKVESLGGSVGDYYLYKAKLKEDDTSYQKKIKLKEAQISDTSKSAIYEASAQKSTLDLYKVLKENNININDYLDYLGTEFKADTNSNGDTISGSKKNKVFNYLNNSNLTYEQKLLIAGKEYALDNSSKSYIAYRIANSGLTNDEKIELYKSMSGFKVDSDGTVRW